MDRETATVEVGEVPGERAQQWVEHHRGVSAPSTHVYDFVWDVTAPAEGPFCTDVDGNVLLDFTTHVAAAPLGYNNPKILDPLAEFDLVDPTKIAGQDFYLSLGGTPEDPDLPGPTHLTERLVELTDHYGMESVFLSNSGAEAMENAMKICYDHRPEAKYGITFEGAFHGRTLGALSLNRSKSVYRRHYPELSGIHDVPYCRDRNCTPETCSCGFFHRDDPVSKLREKLDPKTGHVDPDEVAFIAVEPIQGEGGYRIPSDPFHEEVAALATEHDIPLIADEIQAGMGRTGELWGSDHFAFEPDVMAVAKGLRVGATVSNRDVFPEESGRISSTWGAGDLVSSALGALTLEAIEEYDLLDNATEKGRMLREIVEDDAPDAVTDVRNRGLMFAVEFDDPDRRDAVIENAFRRGLLTLACGAKSIRMLPPLDVTDREIAMGADLFLSAVEDTGDVVATDAA